jgi:hypothetical protein
MLNIIISVMQKPFIKCVIRFVRGLVGFYIAEKKLIRRFQKKAVYLGKNGRPFSKLSLL